MHLIYKARLALIRLGKLLPFVLCGIVALSYAESLFAVFTDDMVLFQGIEIPNKPISYTLGRFCEYDIGMLFLLSVISVAIETCIYNKLGVVYLTLNLGEKQLFNNIEISPASFYVISILNIFITSFIVYKGVKTIIMRKKA